jgi:hypothetical protein
VTDENLADEMKRAEKTRRNMLAEKKAWKKSSRKFNRKKHYKVRWYKIM